jgi:hypothetical protein
MIERTEVDTVARRGRPKGSGIDDTATLQRVAALLSADRRMKPTTAIKQVGVSDPSVVRRLREKLKTSSIVPAPTQAAPFVDAAPSTSRPPQSRRKHLTNHKTRRATVTTHPTVRKQLGGHSPATLPPTDQPSPDELAKRQRESAMLAAYLKAMIETATKSSSPTPQPTAPRSTNPNEVAPNSSTTQKPEQAAQSAPAPNGFQFPGFPPFMQPFLPKQQPATPAVQKQMDGLKLSVEAMTALARLQLHFYENALSSSPLGFMLQGQTMMGQMMLAAFTGRGVAQKKPETDKK